MQPGYAFVALLAACTVHAGGGATSGASSGGASGGTASGGTAAGGTSSGGAGSSGGAELCTGLLHDKDNHPMTPVAKPAVGVRFIDPVFGTTIIRLTDVAADGDSTGVIKTVYSPNQAFNADETRFLLWHRSTGGYLVYDAATYAKIKEITDIAAADLEQVFWDAHDPDLLLYPAAGTNDFYKYKVSTGTKTVLHNFDDKCGTDTITTQSHGFFAWDGSAIGFSCGSVSLIYEIDSDQVTAVVHADPTTTDAPMVSPTGQKALSGLAVVDLNQNVLRTLDMLERGHDSQGLSAVSGHDVLTTCIFDSTSTNPDIGGLVAFDLDTNTDHVIIGPNTGWPYPPSSWHFSAIATHQPGWVAVSVVGNEPFAGGPIGQSVLESEILLANFDSDEVCRVAHHRTWGKANTHLDQPYFAEPHPVISRSGTRILFDSDWDDTPFVDTYIIELPAYAR